jgi:hypothetical protein
MATSDTSYDYNDGDYHCVCTKPSTPPALHRRASHGHRNIRHRGKMIKKRSAAVAFNDRPEMLVADSSNGCMTPHTTAEVKYPNPGPDMVPGDGMYPLELPTGNCG